MRVPLARLYSNVEEVDPLTKLAEDGLRMLLENSPKGTWVEFQGIDISPHRPMTFVYRLGRKADREV